jgi:hypothetical protein
LNVEVEIEELTTVRLNKLNLELEVQGNQWKKESKFHTHNHTNQQWRTKGLGMTHRTVNNGQHEGRTLLSFPLFFFGECYHGHEKTY